MNNRAEFEPWKGTRQKEVIFRKWELFHGHLEVMLPEIFQPMTEENITRYYPKKDRPQVLTSDVSGDYQCMFHHIPEITCQEDNLAEIALSIATLIEENNPLYQISTVHRHVSKKAKIYWFAVNMQMKEQKYEQVEFLLPLQNHLLIGTLLFPQTKNTKWYVIAEETINSIRYSRKENQR